MSSPNGRGFAAFDGRVTFVMTPFVSFENRIAIDVVVDAMMEAYPDYGAMEGTLKSALNIFMLCVAETTAIEFNLSESDHPALHNLATFWAEWQASDDYPSLFQRFLKTIDIDIGNTWWEARDASKLTTLHAPPELQVEGADLPADQKKEEKNP